MPHPRKTKVEHGKLWHLEDFGLTQSHAEVLSNHLRNREDKYARIHKSEHGYEVWWAKR